MKKKIQKNSFGKWYGNVLPMLFFIGILLCWIAVKRYQLGPFMLACCLLLKNHLIQLFFLSIVFGIFLSFFLLRYDKDPEIQWLLSLPVTYRSIAAVKVDAVINGILKMMLFTFLITIPWGSTSEGFAWWCGIMLSAFFVFMAGIAVGMFCSFGIFIISQKIIISYSMNGVFIFCFLFLGYETQPKNLNQKSLLAVCIFCAFSFCVLRKIIYDFFGKVLAVSSQLTDKANKGKLKSTSGGVQEKIRCNSLFRAILKKEIQYYKRESQYILQFIIMLAVLTILIAREAQNRNEVMLGAYVLLYAMPFNLCGLVSIFSFGAEFSLIQTMLIVRGKILPYYYVKILQPFIICFFPLTLIYFIFLLVSGEAFSLTVWLLLESLLLYYALFATATSCFFLKTDENNLVLTRGIQIHGMILYYLLGLAIPIILSFYKENRMDKFPLALGVYLLIQVIYSFTIAAAAPLRLRKKIIS